MTTRLKLPTPVRELADAYTNGLFSSSEFQARLASLIMDMEPGGEDFQQLYSTLTDLLEHDLLAAKH